MCSPLSWPGVFSSDTLLTRPGGLMLGLSKLRLVSSGPIRTTLIVLRGRVRGL